ncbi:ABC transporter ATP-binding protein [Aristaeella lactis]|uniref:ATP-binding cassette, subfamily B n=1 Tax=Aristaeella lactis TaxID=3046383 RepID=A0AC61PLB9_9FIRM|nr:ABC transporter ATP-binding protein [Aristaeella lactis]QUA52228.1 ABC transporter ATP-binding protein [Aristaeella lactis]SMC59230.1 ATP-binding cassette, subfamily B [Aristaeella lactis]
MAGPRGRASYLTDEEKKNSPKITKELITRVFSYLKPYWKQLALVLVCIAVSSVCSLFPSILTGNIIDVLTGKEMGGWIGAGISALVKLIILSLGLTLASSLIGVGETYLNNWIAQHISYDMRNQMYRHLQKMSQRFFTSANQGDIITRMTSDISGVESVVTNTFTSILSNTMTLVVALVAMFQKSWILALVGIAIVPVFTLPTRMAGKKRWKLAGEAQACNDEVNGILNETLSVSGQLLVKLFGREQSEYERYEEANGRMISLNIRERMAGRWFFMLLHTLTSIGPMLLYLVGGILIMKYDSTITVGDITVLVALLGRLYGPVNSLLNIQVDWIRSMAMFTRIFEYYDMKPEIDDKPDAKELKNAKGDINFDHVSFTYDGERMILKDINFTLRSGDCVAIVGPSGSGKSTIVNLIPRLWDPTAGSVTFDGTDVRDLTLHSLRDEVGVVTQETYLFNGTIRENLLYAKPDATEAEMIDACQKANIYDFIKNQPDGLDTMVGNRGLKLSGGEKQRISIARALLKDPALLIFDEATSALDSISEAAIQAAINPLIEERTSILIAHRLSTILAADEILVVRDGEIVERGTHKDLVHAGGTYQELYETQFSKAIE